MTPSGAVAGLFGDGFTAGVIGVTTDLFVLGPRGDKTEASQAAGDATCLVAFDDNGGWKTRIGLIGAVGGQVYTQLFLDPLGALGRSEVRAHGGSLSLKFVTTAAIDPNPSLDLQKVPIPKTGVLRRYASAEQAQGK